MRKYNQNKQEENNMFAYEQGKIFKNFKEDTNFNNFAKQFGINRSTVIFKINIVNLVDKYPKMLT